VEIGGVIFRTTPLPFVMFLTSVLIGAGSLLVGVIIKTTPADLMDKVPIKINEDNVPEGQDFISKVQGKISGNLKRSETERLLDSV